MLIFFTKEYFPFNHNPTNDNEDVFFVFKVNRERRMAYSLVVLSKGKKRV